MCNQLAKLTSLKVLSASNIRNFPNLRALSQFLLSQLQLRAQEGGSVSAAAVEQPANGAMLATAASGLDITAVKKGCLDPNLAFDNIGEVQCPKSVFVTGATGHRLPWRLHSS